MKKLSQLAPKATGEDGREIPFAEFLKEQTAMGELYTSDIREMLDVALNPHTPWDEVDDYLAPIAHQVISAASEHEDKRIYIRLVLAIREAWQDLTPDVQQAEGQ